MLVRASASARRNQSPRQRQLLRCEVGECGRAHSDEAGAEGKHASEGWEGATENSTVASSSTSNVKPRTDASSTGTGTSKVSLLAMTWRSTVGSFFVMVESYGRCRIARRRGDGGRGDDEERLPSLRA